LNRSAESRQDGPCCRTSGNRAPSSRTPTWSASFTATTIKDKESEGKGIAELIVAKNRAGPQETVRLAWLGQYTLFENLAGDAPGTPVHSGPPSGATHAPGPFDGPDPDIAL
jgi:hypothetical protein